MGDQIAPWLLNRRTAAGHGDGGKSADALTGLIGPIKQFTTPDAVIFTEPNPI